MQAIEDWECTPLAAARQPPKDAAVASSRWYNEAVAATRAKRILVVDDDQAIREELAAVLREDPAVDISVADDGWTALQQIATGQFWPDVILLDLMMPRLNGDDFLAALDAINGTREIALIAITALPRTGVSEAVRRRARSILFKPFTLTQLGASLAVAR